MSGPHQTRTVDIVCAPGVRHRLRWERGALTLEDHEIESERALSGLGADLPMCLEVYDAYRAGVGDLDMVTRACNSTSAHTDLFAFREKAKREWKGWIGYAGSASRSVSVAVRKAAEAHSHFWRGSLIWSFPIELRRTFVIDSVDAIERAGTSLRDFDVEELIRAQVTHPLWASLKTWVRDAARDGAVNVRGSLSKPGAHASVTSWPAEVDVAVPLTWFAQVWARGLGGAPDGCFVLDVVEERTPQEMVVRALRWKRAGDHAEPVVAPAVARFLDEGWRLAWQAP